MRSGHLIPVLAYCFHWSPSPSVSRMTTTAGPLEDKGVDGIREEVFTLSWLLVGALSEVTRKCGGASGPLYTMIVALFLNVIIMEV
jgi:hypothetical protein